MINPPSYYSPSPTPPRKKVRPWVWALASLGALVALTMGAMLFLLYAVDWSKWEKKLQGAAPLKTVDSWKDAQEAQKLRARGRFNEAQALYKQAIKKTPNFPHYHKELIRLAAITDNLPDLESFYAALIRDYPKEKTLHHYLAQVYFFTGKYQEALNVFQNEEEKFKSSTNLLNQAVLYAKMGKFTEALEKCEAVKKTPEAWRAHYFLGEIYAYRGDYEKALDEYRRALPSYTWEMNPYQRMGDLYLAQGKTQEAEETYLKLTEKNPQHAKALTSLVHLSLKAGKYEKALNYLGSLEQEESPTFAYHHLYGQAYLGLGRYPEAQKHFTQALYYQPYDSEAAKGLGDSLAAQGKWAEAEGAYGKAISLDPYQREAYLGLQKVYTQQGDTNKAKKIGTMLAKLPKAESLKGSTEKENFVPPRDLELYGIFGGS